MPPARDQADRSRAGRDRRDSNRTGPAEPALPRPRPQPAAIAGIANDPADHASRRSSVSGENTGPERPPGPQLTPAGTRTAGPQHADEAAHEKRSASTSETSEASTRPMRTAPAVRNETVSRADSASSTTTVKKRHRARSADQRERQVLGALQPAVADDIEVHRGAARHEAHHAARPRPDRARRAPTSAAPERSS